MARAKCPMCSQSTSTADGACEFCGHELATEILADAEERALRLAAPSRGAASGVRERSREPARPSPAAASPRVRDEERALPRNTETELRDAEQMGSMSFALALVSIFLIPLVAPIAHRLGRNSLRIYEKHGVPPHWTASTGYWLGLIMSLLILFVLLVTFMFVGIPLLRSI